MFRNGFEIGRVFGVPIRLDASLIILPLVYGIAMQSLRVGLVFTVILMGSVALHELGHTYTALKFGCRVRDITLMLLGGRATLLDMPREPWKEFVLAASGPLVSAVLWLGGRLLILVTGAQGLTGLFLFYLALVNKCLLFFNLIPAFPMDGGRMLRALLARRVGRLLGTFIASRIGRFVAVMMGIWGIFHFNFILVLIAIYIYQAAGFEYLMAQAEAARGNDFFFFGGPKPPPSPHDQVIISPPPYRSDHDVADVYKER